MSEYYVYMDWDEVTASENRNCLKEGVKGMKCKACIGCYSFRFVMNKMKIAIDFRVVE